MTFLGCIIVAAQGSIGNLLLLTLNIGDLLILLAILFYAGYSLGLKNRPLIPGLAMMGYFSIAALIMSIPLVVIESLVSGFRFPTENGWYIVLYANLVPIFSALMAILILDETIRFYHLTAMLIIFSGIFLFENKKPNLG